MRYTAEQKTLLIAAWQSGASENELTRDFNIPKTTLRGWVKKLTRTAVAPKPKANEPDWETIDDIAEDWTRAQGMATLAILRKAQDDSWLDRQSAHDLGVFYGIIADKQLRLLAAFKPRDNTAGNLDANASANRAGEAQPA